MTVPACTFLKNEDKAIKVVVAIRAEQDVQGTPRALYRRREPIPAEASNHGGARPVAVADFHVVVAAAVIGLQAEQQKPAAEYKTFLNPLFANCSLLFRIQTCV